MPASARKVLRIVGRQDPFPAGVWFCGSTSPGGCAPGRKVSRLDGGITAGAIQLEVLLISLRWPGETVRRTGSDNRPVQAEVGSARGTNFSVTVRGVTVRLVAGGRSGVRGLLRAPDIDLVIALAAFGALLADPLLEQHITGVTPLIGILAFLTAVPLAARRRFPLGVLAIEVPLLMTCLIVFHPERAVVGITMLLVFTVGLEGGRTRSLVVGALMALVVTAAAFLTGRRAAPAEVTAYAALVLGALFAGDALRGRQALQRTIAEEAARAREAAAQHRFDAERLALAQELHDIVGHTLVAINVRAAAAARRARKGTVVDAPAALDEIASASAGALAELRIMLKALRAAQDGPAPLHPFHDLANLADLISGVADAGLSVDLEVAGRPAALPAAVSHAGYRIAQEGLTNVLRHSTARHARVRVDAGERAVVIEVLDDGRPRAAILPAGGHGLAGMRERAAALGGTCEAGPVNGTGWRVRAEIPVGSGGS